METRAPGKGKMRSRAIRGAALDLPEAIANGINYSKTILEAYLMNSKSLFQRNAVANCCVWSIALCSAAMLGFGVMATAASSSASPVSAKPDKEWAEIDKDWQPLPYPEEWRANRPSPEAIARFRKENAELAYKAADRAKSFYTRYPDHDKAINAKEKEVQLLAIAAELGNENALQRLNVLEQELLKDPKLSEADRFSIRAGSVQRSAMRRQSEGNAAVLAEFEKGVRTLQKEFPNQPEVYEMLFEIASNAESPKAQSLLKEIIQGPASDEIRLRAQLLQKRFGLLGKPLAIRFAALDDREVDLAKLQGKVILVDFWATWCGPCVAGLPDIKAAYEKLHPKGFEIVGISFDNSKQVLEWFITKEKIPWPQYFDGKGWQNKFGQQFGISSIPAMWLVDKKGNLRDLNARTGLQEKVEKLLSE